MDELRDNGRTDDAPFELAPPEQIDVTPEIDEIGEFLRKTGR